MVFVYEYDLIYFNNINIASIICTSKICAINFEIKIILKKK